MDVTPQELRSSEIKDSWRGYDRDEVDDLLERAAVTIESLTQQVQESPSRPVPAAPAAVTPADVPLPSSRDDADMLQRTLLLAQRAADDAVSEAQARAKHMLEESEAKAQMLVSDAEATARRIAEGERRRLEGEILELSARRDRLRVDADALEAYASGYRDRIRAAIEHDLGNLGDHIDPPSERPELHEIELPIEPAPAAVAEAAPAPAAPGSAPAASATDDAWDAGPATRALGRVDAADPVGQTGPFAAEASATRAPVAAPPRPEPAAEWPPVPAPEAATATAAAPGADSSWLASGDDWSTSNAAWDTPAPWEDRDPSPRPEPDSYAKEVAMEANAIDTDSLDDDAFFASLREAVRDDAPLGPRDDDQAQPQYGAESEQDRRRFRRRR